MDEQHAETSPAADLSLDTVYHLLSNRRRRAALAILKAHDRTLTVNDVSKEIVAREYDVPITDMPVDEMIRITFLLTHAHIPKLAAAQVVEYNPDRGLVEPTARFEALEPHLSMAIEADPML